MRFGSRLRQKPGTILIYTGPVFTPKPPVPPQRMRAWTVEKGPANDAKAWCEKLQLPRRLTNRN